MPWVEEGVDPQYTGEGTVGTVGSTGQDIRCTGGSTEEQVQSLASSLKEERNTKAAIQVMTELPETGFRSLDLFT